MMGRKKELLWETVPNSGGFEFIPGALLFRKAEVLELVGDWAGAEAIYSFLHDKGQALGWPAWLRPTLKRYGLLQQRLNKLSQAWENFQKLYDLAKSEGDRLLQADALIGFGIVLWKQGKLMEAESRYLEAAALLGDDDEETMRAALYNNLGVLYENLGRYSESLDCYQKKLQIEEKHGNLAGLSRLNNNLGICYMHKGDLDNAEKCLQKRMELTLRMGDIFGQATALVNLAVLDRMRNRYREALLKYEKARELYRRLGERKTSEVTINLNMGHIYLDLEDYSQARIYFHRCLEAAESYGDKRTIGIVYYDLGQIEYHQGDSQRALEYCNRSLEILERTLQPYYLLESLLFRAEVLCHLKRSAEAMSVLERALSLACQLGKKEEEWKIREMMDKIKVGGNDDE